MGKYSLSSVSFFKGLPEDRLGSIEHRCTLKSYKANERVVGHLEDSTDVYFVINGKLRAIIYSVAGKAIALRNIGAGGIFGEFAAIDGRPRSASIEALENSLVARMPAELFWETITDQPPFARAIIRHLVRQTRAMTERVFELSALAVNNRVQAELFRMALEGEVVGNTARIEKLPTHSEIASRISARREAVTRELNRLNNLGLTEREGSALMIADLQQLAEMVMDVTGELNLVAPYIDER